MCVIAIPLRLFIAHEYRQHRLKTVANYKKTQKNAVFGVENSVFKYDWVDNYRTAVTILP
jgi:hypothetical protein